MSKPPRATPHSDLDGVREDEERNIDVANAVGDDGADLEEARKKSIGRPRPENESGLDDRSK